MNIKNCRECGCIFPYYSGPKLCPTCLKKLNEKFNEVKEFIRNTENPTVSIVAEACDVSEKQILQWLREERLELIGAPLTGLNCERCGAPITTGRYCKECKTKLMHELNDAVMGYVAPKKEDTETGRMRYTKH